MKLLFVVGARPNFIKLAPVLEKAKSYEELECEVVHTGQHFDKDMSDVFFSEMNIARPNYHLNVGADTQTKQTAKMMSAMEDLFLEVKPDCVVVIGDVSSTIAAAMVTSKLCIKLVHIESGLRSYNRTMPEEINRIVTDHLSDRLYAPSQLAMKNLENEGLLTKSIFSGDVMYDAVLRHLPLAELNSRALVEYSLNEKDYYLATLHRPYNVDDIDTLSEIVSTFKELEKKVLFAVHPRTRKNLELFGIEEPQNIIFTKPLGYLDFLVLQKNAIKILTDSGGVQKEAMFVGTPCITLRSETEWIETIECGANILVTNRTKQEILNACARKLVPNHTQPYGTGNASELILEDIIRAI